MQGPKVEAACKICRYDCGRPGSQGRGPKRQHKQRQRRAPWAPRSRPRGAHAEGGLRKDLQQ